MNKFSRLLAKIFQWLLPALPIIGAFVLMAMFAEPALAVGPEDWSAWTGPLAVVVSGVILIIVLFAFIFALFLGDLMDSTFILDTGMGDTLHLVWEVVRNFVNVGFILILLVIAVMVIFGGGGERGLGLLKKVLPKFVLALILVNFTFFAARFVLTANDVLATAIFSLPRTVSGEQMIRMPCDPKDPRSCIDQMRDTMEKAAGGSAAASEKIAAVTEAIAAKDRWFPQTVKDLSLGKKNIGLVLLSSMIDLEHIVHIKGVDGDGADLAITAIGSLIVAGAVGIIFFMLFLAFVVRMVVLWVAIAVSPLAALGIVLKELIPGLDMGKSGFDPVKVFISHAFMPTMVAIPLSIGMIMIFANNAVGFDTSTGWIETFSHKSGDIHALLWWIASIIVIWFGTNKMIKEASPDFAAKLTDGIHGGVNKFVGAAAGTLKYAPIIPASMGGSVSGLINAPQMTQSKLQTHNLQNKQALAEKFASPYKMFGYTSAPATINSLTAAVKNIDPKLTGKDKQNAILQTTQTKFAELEGNQNSTIGAPLAKIIKDEFHIGNIENSTTLRETLDEIAKHDKGHSQMINESLIPKFTTKKEVSVEKEKSKIQSELGEFKSTVAGDKVEEKEMKGGNPVEGFEINGKQVYEVNGTYFIKHDKEDDSKGGSKVLLSKDMADKLVDLGDGERKDVGKNASTLLKSLRSIKELLNSDAGAKNKEVVKSRIKGMLKTKGIHKDHEDNLQRAWNSVFGEQDFTKTFVLTDDEEDSNYRKLVVSN
ncbi:hypothetical protein KAI54_01555 [Candidatus Gracilibacteria bacterium]|nr:hypothetical protein [Candidatus Gracilibacteria bacterium]